MKEIDNNRDWKKSKADIFWGEIAPCDHVVQIYEDDEVFIDVLAGFVYGGVTSGEGIILIATDTHLQALEKRLLTFGINTELLPDDQYITMNAEDLLSCFMVNGWPDEDLFMKAVTGLIRDAGKNRRKVRAFGEMVAILWAQGHNGATVHLEHLWNKICANDMISVFCAYPQSGFTEDINVSIKNICGAHTKMITAAEKPFTDLTYRRLEKKND